ncbi:PucR family transcriptional regulator ligand-binding domain-containing protein [Streptomyces sp. NBC_01498]|uniref:PucR family transcriptional regulator ligand-binding domain-containing protein n=1 Tax=Streptomyces sp. NBC_01498 TaxID=2975870 RepID=UPI002E7AE01B|nr:PucR family transcriptional regulator ligand-binding domain-containing protein [Streptomyces sp. NBC_01498]WTL23867.1 PucR family transcriptional regulator ligand-binding domain-containing protein [Streptomyces sp. NBC_01498]
MRLRALLETDALGLRLLGGGDELDRSVRGVMTTDLRDPSRYLSGGELVLTGLAWRRAPEDSEAFVRLLTGAGVAGLAAGEAELGAIPDDLVGACARHRLPLFAVNEAVAFASITEYVVRRVSGERAGDLAAVVDRHHRLMTSGPGGGGPEVVLDLLGTDLDLRAWVLSPTGRRIAGGPLAAPAGAALAAEHLAATRAGRRAPHRVALGGKTYSLFPVRGAAGPAGAASGGPAGDVRARVLSDWLLAVESDAGEWGTPRLDLLRGVTELIAVERDRREAARTVRRRLAQEILGLVRTGAPPADIAARLRVAAPVLVPGRGAEPYWQLVVARVDWADGAGPDETGTGTESGTGGGTGEDEAGAVARSVLEEILADPATADPESGDRIAVAHSGGEAVALLPMPGPESAPGPDGDGALPGPMSGGLHAETLLAAVREPLAAGLADDGRLTLGVSAAVRSAEGLRGALEEARHARRVAAARPGPVCGAGHHELASHVLLLPFVPDDVRRAFTARLLDPLRDYDRRHRAELVPTLEAFLDCDGSWTRCAARLHLHVNTLRYRVGRIEQLTGRDLARLEDKLDFFLALRMS